MTAIKLNCCHPNCNAVATWGFWVAPDPEHDCSCACDAHLGEMLPHDGSSHHATAVRFNVWHLDRGYDGTTCSSEEIETAYKATIVRVTRSS